MAQSVNFGEVPVGSNCPRIVAVVSGAELSAVEEAKLAREAGADILEFRADLHPDPEHAGLAIDEIKREFPDFPILLTVRGDEDWGGFPPGPESKRFLVFQALIPKVQAVDIELYSTEINRDVVALARECDVSVIASFHHFLWTPTKEDFRQFAKDALELGADILKIAVVAERQEDVYTLQEFTAEQHAILVATMSMGEIGAASRIVNPFMGSCLTYGYIGATPTTPGQIHVHELRQLFDRYGEHHLRLDDAKRVTADLTAAVA